MKQTFKIYFVITMALTAFQTYAAQLTVTNTFSSGTPAVASEVNTNFSDVKTAVNDNDSRIAALETAIATLQATVNTQASTISSLQSQLATVNSSQVMALEPYLTVDTTTDNRGPQIRLSGVNLQIVNGTGTTDGTPNGLGNLIVGYDRVRTDINQHFCSDGSYIDQTTCESNGGTWGISLKSGSHYIIVGDDNNYTQYGGIVNGTLNTSNSAYASVLGGIYSIASGLYSTTSGGYNSKASGESSSVSGGYGNTASGVKSSVSGGYGTTASGAASSVSGGQARSASGSYNWAAGSLLETN